MTSSIFGIPISGTHTVIGAVIGAGLAVEGVSCINWKQLGTVVLSWFVSPIVAGIISCYFFTTICILTLDPGTGKKCLERPNCRLITLTLIAGSTSCFMSALLLSLLTNEMPSTSEIIG
jgi:phosphate/sulfate permease